MVLSSIVWEGCDARDVPRRNHWGFALATCCSAPIPADRQRGCGSRVDPDGERSLQPFAMAARRCCRAELESPGGKSRKRLAVHERRVHKP